ncbi:MAG: hypothetical protein WDZ33_00540 [Balneolaceae bacterium]
MKQGLAILLLWMLAIQPLSAQEIDFGSYGSYTVSLDIIEDLQFGMLVRGSGPEDAIPYHIDLTEALVIDIIGVPYLDVDVEVTVLNNGYLLLNNDSNCIGDPTCSIPFTLQAAYSNAGEEHHSPGTAEIIPVVGNTANIRFPILKRQFQPPGPPPPPPTAEIESSLSEETAQVLLYGSVEVANVDVGEYVGQIDITVTYD